MNILDVDCLIDIERYQKINVDAQGPPALHRDPADLAIARNVEFLRRCLREFREVNFSEQSTGRIYLRVELGVVTYVDAPPDAAKNVLDNVLPGTSCVKSGEPRYLDADERVHTVGAWRDAGAVVT